MLISLSLHQYACEVFALPLALSLIPTKHSELNLHSHSLTTPSILPLSHPPLPPSLCSLKRTTTNALLGHFGKNAQQLHAARRAQTTTTTTTTNERAQTIVLSAVAPLPRPEQCPTAHNTQQHSRQIASCAAHVPTRPKHEAHLVCSCCGEVRSAATLGKS